MSKRDYTHYTLSTLDLNRTYNQPVNSSKPDGLWMSIDNEWFDYCQNVDWRVSDSDKLVRRVIDVHESSRVIRIDSEDSAYEFSEMYCTDESWTKVDWSKVSSEYDGVLVVPNIEFMTRCRWTDGWDVSTLVIWNLNMIEERK